MALRLAALWLALIAPAELPGGGGAGGVVVVDALEVLDEPSDTAYASWTLRRGDRVEFAAPGPAPAAGWRGIVPPAGSFDWIDAAAIQPRDDGSALVIAPRAGVRSGASDARMPGPPRGPLAQGAVVRLVDRPPLTLGQGSKTRTWRAIRPPPEQVRYVRDSAIGPDATKDTPPPAPAVDPAVEPTQGRRKEPSASPADAVRRFEDAVRRSRALDADTARIRDTLALARTGTERGYDARGMLQASSRQVEGQKVHALIGPEGRPIAYLAIPPGIAAHRLLSRKVGVRGDVHYNELLGTRLITVRDLDPLDRPR